MDADDYPYSTATSFGSWPSVVPIPLRRRDGSVRAYALVSSVDAHLLAIRWMLESDGYVERRPGRGAKALKLHREAAGLDAADPRVVDHIDHDKLNNLRSNLRVITRGQNVQNRRGAAAHSKSGVRGVSWDASRGKWFAKAKLEGKQYALGRYDTIEEATAVVEAWRREHMPFSTS